MFALISLEKKDRILYCVKSIKKKLMRNCNDSQMNEGKVLVRHASKNQLNDVADKMNRNIPYISIIPIDVVKDINKSSYNNTVCKTSDEKQKVLANADLEITSDKDNNVSFHLDGSITDYVNIYDLPVILSDTIDSNILSDEILAELDMIDNDITNNIILSLNISSLDKQNQTKCIKIIENIKSPVEVISSPHNPNKNRNVLENFSIPHTSMNYNLNDNLDKLSEEDKKISTNICTEHNPKIVRTLDYDYLDASDEENHSLSKNNSSIYYQEDENYSVSTDLNAEVHSSTVINDNSTGNKSTEKSFVLSTSQQEIDFTPCDIRMLNVDHSRGSKGDHKKHFCVYCHTEQTAIARHLLRRHGNEPEVAKFKHLRAGCPERQKIIETIRRKGDHLYNINPEFNKGERKVVRRPQAIMEKTGKDFEICAKCKGHFAKSTLRHHFRKCGNVTNKNQRPVLVMSRKIVCSIHPVASDVLKNQIFPILRDGEVVDVIRYDELIILCGNKLCLKHKLLHQHKIVRHKMRLLGRFLMNMKRTNKDIKDLASVYVPEHYDNVIVAINRTAEYCSANSGYNHPTVALDVSTTLKFAGQILITKYIKERNKSGQEDVENFLKIFIEGFNTNIGKTVSENQMAIKRIKQVRLPSMHDIKKLDDHLKVHRQKYLKLVQKEFTPNNWKLLAEDSLTSVQLFNRRRAGEIERLLISDYKSRKKKKNVDPDLYNGLNEQQRKVAETYERFEIRGKLNRNVPVLLYAELTKCINVILKYRHLANVPENNEYVFGIPSRKDGRFQWLEACKLMRQFSERCNAQVPSTLRGTELRKHIATICVTLNLESHEISDLANFMGHADKIHKQNYRQPLVAREILKISQLLQIAQQGTENDVNLTSDEEDLDISVPGCSLQVNDLDSSQNISDNFSSPEMNGTKKKLTSSTKNRKSIDDVSDSSLKKKRSTSPYGKTIRRRWTKDEVTAVKDLYGNHIENKTLPSFSDIHTDKRNNNALKFRTPSQIKTWISNQHSRK